MTRAIATALLLAACGSPPLTDADIDRQQREYATRDAYPLSVADCGRVVTVDERIDTRGLLLPAPIAACEIAVMYTGVDGGAAVDLLALSGDFRVLLDDGARCHYETSPGGFIHDWSLDGFSWARLIKATARTGDLLLVWGTGEDWVVRSCVGSWEPRK